jgi:hypothetical protein
LLPKESSQNLPGNSPVAKLEIRWKSWIKLELRRKKDGIRR